MIKGGSRNPRGPAISVLRAALLVREAERLPWDIWKHIRDAVMERDDGVCQLRRSGGFGPICGEPAVVVDHIRPKKWGGGDNLGNLRASCYDCNDRKGSRPPFLWVAARAAILAPLHGVALAWAIWGAPVVAFGSSPVLPPSTAVWWAAVATAEQARTLKAGDPGSFRDRDEAVRVARMWSSFGDGADPWIVVPVPGE